MKYKILVFIIHFRIQLYCIGSVMYNVLDSSVVDSLSKLKDMLIRDELLF